MPSRAHGGGGRAGRPGGPPRPPPAARDAAQVGEHDRRRVRVDEQVREHRLADLLDPRLAEPDAEAAADHHGLRVEQVHGGGDAVAERLDGLLEQLLRHLVAALQRSLPDAAGQPVAPALLHDLEQVRLLALLDAAAGGRPPPPPPPPGAPPPLAPRPAWASRQPRRPHGQRAPSILTTMWPISAAVPRPSHGLPSRMIPPPTPVPQKTPSSDR